MKPDPVEHGRCPLCGSPTITDGELEWCTFVGGMDEPPCRYGIDEHVFIKPDGTEGDIFHHPIPEQEGEGS